MVVGIGWYHICMYIYMCVCTRGVVVCLIDHNQAAQVLGGGGRDGDGGDIYSCICTHTHTHIYIYIYIYILGE